MKNNLNFFLQVGKLKSKARRGWQLHSIKNAESTAEHIFRTALVAWILGREKGLDVGRVIKLALVHDLCEVYAPDMTPYDPLLRKDGKNAAKILKSWPKLTPALKMKKQEKKYALESKSLDKLTSSLPPLLRAEIKNLWLDFEKGLTKEGRFVKQVDKIENLLQGLEYWKRYGKIQHRLWMRWIKEIIDDPVLLEFIKVAENNFCGNNKK